MLHEPDEVEMLVVPRAVISLWLQVCSFYQHLHSKNLEELQEQPKLIEYNTSFLFSSLTSIIILP